MNQTDEIHRQIIQGDLQILWNLMETIKDESIELQHAYTKAKYGINHTFHIEWILKGLHDIRDKEQSVLCQGKLIPIEEWWDEEQQRRSILRRVLFEYYTNNAPYEAR